MAIDALVLYSSRLYCFMNINMISGGGCSDSVLWVHLLFQFLLSIFSGFLTLLRVMLFCAWLVTRTFGQDFRLEWHFCVGELSEGDSAISRLQKEIMVIWVSSKRESREECRHYS